eukprot:3911446-Rhodomonas_salina.2
MAKAARKRPRRGSAAQSICVASNKCCVTSGSVIAWCSGAPATSGAKLAMRKCRRGNGTRLVASLRRSQLSWPGKRREHVTPDITWATTWLSSENGGAACLRRRVQMRYSASLSRQTVASAFSTNQCIDSVALYGSTTQSDTCGDGITEKVSIILSGYSSRIFEISSVPMPPPVPPPSEWQI